MGIAGRGVLNVSAAVFLSLAAVLLVRSKHAPAVVQEVRRTGWWWLLPALAACAGYLRSLPFSFVFDDYVHLSNAAAEGWSGMLRRVAFVHPTGGDLFFRPVGYISYWLSFRWAAFQPAAWHTYGLAVHVLNTLLVFALCRRLFAKIVPAVGASLLFAVHGAHVEAVCWMAAQFDLLATFFVLVALLFAVRPSVARRGEILNRLAVCAAAMLACLSKESAYALPLLILCIGFFLPGLRRRAVFQNAAWAAGACAVVFVYRLWYLRGIGGYQSSLQGVHLASLLQGLIIRLWSFLFVPVNWSFTPGWWLAIPLSIAILLAVTARVDRVRLVSSLCFTICAAIPVFALLLIGPNMSGARVLYLPSVGMVLFWAVVMDGTRQGSMVCGAMVLFQFAALWHNQKIWGEVTASAREACVTAGQLLQRDPSATIYAYDLPRLKDGVFFLANGFPQCVAIAGGGDVARVAIGSRKDTRKNMTEHLLTYDTKAEKLREVIDK